MASFTDIARLLNAEGIEALSHAQWGAKVGQWSPKRPQRFPAVRSFAHHSVTGVSGDPIRDARLVESIGLQRFGILSYPFLIHPIGIVLQGCFPWVGAHTKGLNSTALAACHIGNYETSKPTNAQLVAHGRLLAACESLGLILADAPLDGHRDAPGASTACPGRHLYAQLPTIRRIANDDKPTTPVTEEPEMFAVTQDSTGHMWIMEPGRRTLVPAGDRKAVTAAMPHFRASDELFVRLIEDRARYQ